MQMCKYATNLTDVSDWVVIPWTNASDCETETKKVVSRPAWFRDHLTSLTASTRILEKQHFIKKIEMHTHVYSLHRLRVTGRPIKYGQIVTQSVSLRSAHLPASSFPRNLLVNIVIYIIVYNSYLVYFSFIL